MMAIAGKRGLPTSLVPRFAQDQSQVHAGLSEQILDDFRQYIAQMEPKLPELFTLLPKSPVTVEAIPEFTQPQ